MSLQVFLQARILGSEDFLSGERAGHGTAADDLGGRCAWLTLAGEVLPRALLSELKLSRMLLGSSSAEQFLLVLAEEEIAQANDFLQRAADAIGELSLHTLKLVWATTENLGAWPVVRKRIEEALAAKISAPLTSFGRDIVGAFAPFTPLTKSSESSYFTDFAERMAGAKAVGWSPEHPALLTWDTGAYTWPLTEQSSSNIDAILFPRRLATDEEGAEPGTLEELATRADGSPRWGILRGDVDHFEVQLRRAASIEDHIHFSALLKEFLAGELGILCSLPEFWRKVMILYRGGEDFAVAGSWDALVLFARELERLFAKFVEQHLSTLPGVEAKSISMALAIASDVNDSPTEIFREAGLELRNTKANELGSIHLFGRTLEWKRLNDAEELKVSLVRLVREFHFPPDYINDLASVYREAFAARAGHRNKTQRMDRPWRTYMRLSRVIPQPRGKEQANLRNAVITGLVGRRTAGLKLRPSARVGLEWARLAAGN
jgi:CRISPR-associated protein Csm1